MDTATDRAGGWWLPSFATVAICLLMQVPWRWSRPAVAALIAAQVPLAVAFPAANWPDAPAARVPFFAVTLGWRTAAVFIPVRLLGPDPSAAHGEMVSLTGVAEAALRDMRAVTWDEHGVSLAAEAAAARAVLQAAGVTADIDVALPGLAPDLDAVPAWAVREGATNILRHSRASRVSVTARRASGRVRLDIVNDGAPARGDRDGGAGTGLAGLAGRARAAGGTAAGEHSGAGSFRLRVELPEEAP